MYYNYDDYDELNESFGDVYYYTPQYDELHLKYCIREDFNIIPADFLTSRNVRLDYRTKVVEWLAECVLTGYLSKRVFFAAVKLLDYYMYFYTAVLDQRTICLVGMASLYMASKYDDVKIKKLKIK
jgi:hypothetical protein